MYSQSLSYKSVFRISQNCKWGKLLEGKNPLFTHKFVTPVGSPLKFKDILKTLLNGKLCEYIKILPTLFDIIESKREKRDLFIATLGPEESPVGRPERLYYQSDTV